MDIDLLTSERKVKLLRMHGRQTIAMILYNGAGKVA